MKILVCLAGVYLLMLAHVLAESVLIVSEEVAFTADALIMNLVHVRGQTFRSRRLVIAQDAKIRFYVCVQMPFQTPIVYSAPGTVSTGVEFLLLLLLSTVSNGTGATSSAASATGRGRRRRRRCTARLLRLQRRCCNGRRDVRRSDQGFHSEGCVTFVCLCRSRLTRECRQTKVRIRGRRWSNCCLHRLVLDLAGDRYTSGSTTLDGYRRVEWNLGRRCCCHNQRRCFRRRMVYVHITSCSFLDLL
jgi:hypothetical protein